MTEKKKFLKIIKLNNVYGKVITNNPFIVKDLYNYFSMFVKDHWFQPKVKAGTWDGKIHLVWKNGTFPLGLYSEVLQFVKRNDLTIKVDKKLKNKTEIKNFNDITLSWLNSEWIPRTYQVEGALKAIRNRRCILEHATGSGKSLTLALTMMYFFITEECKKTLILVPSLGLIEQMKSDLISYGVPEEWIGKFNKDVKNRSHPIIISTWQSMCKQKKLTSQFDLLITDECHSLRGDVVRSVSENAINADIRIGCTGTMPDFKTDKYQVISTLGPILHIVKAKKLIEKGYISDIKIKLYHLNYPDELKKELKGADYTLEKEFIENYSPRNNVIKFITHKHVEKDHNILILATKLDHLDRIKEKLETDKMIKHIFLINGETPADEREKIRKFTNENKGVVIVASSGVFSTGISIKRLHSVIFASAGKSKRVTIQSIGRGLRLHREKKKLMLYDISDSFKYSEKHLEERVAMYTDAEFDLDMKEINL